jgi:endonuclease G
MTPATSTKLFAVSLLAALTVLVPARRGAGETDAKFKATKNNQPATCATLWQGVGRPGIAKSDQRDTTFVCHTRYVLSHNNTAKTADWVIERLPKRQVSGDFDRPKGKSFAQEKNVPPRGRARDEDYTNTPLDFVRGHMAPSEDFNVSDDLMKESFILSNAVPQVGAKFNGSIWGRLEEEVRMAAKARGELHVITGPVRMQGSSRTRTIAKADNACGNEIKIEGPPDALVCEAHNNDRSVLCTTGVAVPVALFKIIYDRKKAAAYAFVLPNRDHSSKTDAEARPYLETFRTTVAAVQDVTGLQFFLNLQGEKRKRVVQSCATDTLWPAS